MKRPRKDVKLWLLKSLGTIKSDTKCFTWGQLEKYLKNISENFDATNVPITNSM